jgi:hypothetical protein
MALLGALLGGSAPASGVDLSLPVGERLAQLQEASKTAREAKDYRGYRARLLDMRDLLNGHPEVVYGLARAEALLGHKQAALSGLRTYADMKLARAGVAEEEAFAGLRGQSAFRDAVRRIDANRRPLSRATLALTLPEKDLVPEDLAYDPQTGTFFVSSVRHRKILAIAKGGAVSELTHEGQDGLWAVLALAVDAPRRRLWATTAAMPQAIALDAADAGRTALLRYDLGSGKLVKRYELPKPAAGGEQVLGDMALDASGNVFVSENNSGVIYTLRGEKDELEPLVPAGTFLSPQNPAATPDGKRLFVADYSRGIGVVDLKTRKTSWLKHPQGVALNGIDGLYLAGTSLLAVQNGTEPNRVLRLRLDKALSRVLSWDLIESGSPQLGVPTHGVIAEGAFYFLGNSGWDRLEEDGSEKKGAAFEAPVVLRFPLR